MMHLLCSTISHRVQPKKTALVHAKAGHKATDTNHETLTDHSANGVVWKSQQSFLLHWQETDCGWMSMHH
jgi:hypothetical protein